MTNRFMYILLACALFQTICATSDTPQKNFPEFVILMTSYNNEKYAKESLKSVCHQKTALPYQVICINDCSTDRTGEILDKYVRKHRLESYVTIIHNKQRIGALQNIYQAIHTLIPDHKIVVNVDGDDRLAGDEVLAILEQKYADPDIWITYGTALQVPKGKLLLSKAISESAFLEKRIRAFPFVACQHLRTFKAGLFKKIRKDDLLYKGEFCSVAWDTAMMFPMLEMAGPKVAGAKNHTAHVKEVVYFYNVDNPINDFRVRRKLQREVGKYTRSKEPYEPIDSL